MCGVGFIASRKGERSHALIGHALSALQRMAHRGGTGGDGESGDGAGVLLHVPDALFRSELQLPERYGVGMLFLRGDVRDTLKGIAERSGFSLIAFRDVPVRPGACGPSARASCPEIVQMFVAPESNYGDLETQLYHLRRRIEKSLPEVYVCSFSSKTIVYKGLLQPEALPAFFPDLQNPLCQSGVALFHQRFSTNTVPSWARAHPYRLVAHNGEFNTIRGNEQAMRARGVFAHSDRLSSDIIHPVIDASGSDSSMFDNVLEFALRGGMSIERAATMLIPEAWEHADLAPEIRAYCEHQASLCEPWDGPALVLFSDGDDTGAILDRNGLRPARWIETDDYIALCSEWGAVDLGEVRARGRLRPGEIMLVRNGERVVDAALKHRLAREDDYGRWSARNIIRLAPDGKARPQIDQARALRVFGYGEEELRILLQPMGARGEEPIGSMGNDTPLAVFSDRPQPLFNYFRQLFAQVTNPPIDAIREEQVTSLAQLLGPQPNFFSRCERAPRAWIDEPILSDEDTQALLALDAPRAALLETLFTDDLAEALAALGKRAEAAVIAGAGILILSDRGFDARRAPIPSLLALAAVHQHLLHVGLRTQTSLVVESGEPREVMHVCLLIGCGAEAVNPYLAQKVVGDAAAMRHALSKGLRKTMSKMGISTVRSYTGAQIFEALGLAKDLAEKYFPAMTARLHAHGLERFAANATRLHAEAFASEAAPLPNPGVYQWRRDGEHHAYNPETIPALQHAVRSGDYKRFKKYTAQVDAQAAKRTLRGRLAFAERAAIPLAEVEPAGDIVKRFKTGAMSLGSISPEAHENLARAMNRLGGKSNTGEGGEDPVRFTDERRSAIKQVASGRFGVTIEYLNSADELQIKIAQGAKPGEGGQLPGDKVDGLIARLRCATPGTQLISPPPHHDIYSIEDLAQLIFDLKQANPKARVSVKLVAEAGVGTVAAGVAKTGADVIVISGDSGGTGAAPLSSVKHAGVPWELGLAEAQQALRLNGLRAGVRLETDGQLKTGRDVVVGALLGAEEFAFATAALIASGCIMMRVCHLNTCPVGIATQDPILRARFTGQPEHVINFMSFVAEEVREHMATLGVRRFDELIGRTDWLQATGEVDLSALLADTGGARRGSAKRGEAVGVVLTPHIDISQRALGTQRAGHRARHNTTKEERHDFTGTAGQSFGAFAGAGLTLVLHGEANDYFGKGLSGGRLVAMSDIGNVALYGATGGEAFIRGTAGERFAVRNSGAVAVVEGVGDHGCEYMTRGAVIVLGDIGRNFAAGMSGGVAFALRGLEPNDDVIVSELQPSDEKFVKYCLRRHYDATQSPLAWRMLAAFHEYSFRKIVPQAVLLARSAQDKVAANAMPNMEAKKHDRT